MRGDDKISVIFKFLIIINVGDGLEGGFIFVWVRFYDFLWDFNN